MKIKRKQMHVTYIFAAIPFIVKIRLHKLYSERLHGDSGNTQYNYPMSLMVIYQDFLHFMSVKTATFVYLRNA